MRRREEASIHAHWLVKLTVIFFAGFLYLRQQSFYFFYLNTWRPVIGKEKKRVSVFHWYLWLHHGQVLSMYLQCSLHDSEPPSCPSTALAGGSRVLGRAMPCTPRSPGVQKRLWVLTLSRILDIRHRIISYSWACTVASRKSSEPGLMSSREGILHF